MARIVVLWRCKCGTPVKVVAEADSSLPATQMAACPKCHHARSIGADKIISVTEDTSAAIPAKVSPCQEKERLLVVHDKALHIYLRGASELADSVGVLAHAEFECFSNKVRAARQSALEIRKQLNEHIATHHC
jgi:hypothetical protein